jgi:hypothetical protein
MEVGGVYEFAFSLFVTALAAPVEPSIFFFELRSTFSSIGSSSYLTDRLRIPLGVFFLLFCFLLTTVITHDVNEGQSRLQHG